ncbi:MULTISPECIES: hypothetical protein [Sphingosinicellaceae]|uniref:hypothetical protein n=1 Tax=Sphingosinicellaceae TaxID=2820280 RepID=UPI001C1E1FB5|nr:MULTISPECIES: hypothetical protein [Polymorphobacter]QYE32984.1 hypothetical protein KZX46_02210 [Polymorphobacter sp. PAMC 29334]UAJ12244.1 hypothetical protein KTC28_20630 [Polymorphobacter megasporae]
MKLLLIFVGAITLMAAGSSNARKAHKRVLPPVPQSAEIAALNRASLAKIKQVPTPARP